VACLLALHWWWAVTALIGKGVTNDEPVHLASGYCYWRFSDYRNQPENGNLPQRWGALPLLAMSLRLAPAYAPNEWRMSDQWHISNRFLFLSGNNADYMVFCARSAMAFWSVATGLLVFLWSRRLWGDWGGILSLVLYVVSPTILAHGPLVTSDMCAAFWLLAAAGAWWRASGRMTWMNLLLSCAATGLAFVTKFSAPLLIPVFALLGLLRVFASGEIELRLFGGPRPVDRAGGKAGMLIGLLAANGIATWLIIWTFFGWRYGAFGPELPAAVKFYLPTELVLSDAGILTGIITVSFKWHLLPQAYLQGFAHMLYQAQGRGAFLLGSYSNTGWWWFFPYAFLIKSSLGELLITGLLVVAAVLHLTQPSGGRRRIGDLAPLLALGGVYWAFSLLTTLNIGHRHILPTYPVFFILSGVLLLPEMKASLRALAVVAVLTSAVESASIRPHYLAFFNALGGGPTDGWRHLVDSSIDWGQDLPGVAEWVRLNRRPGEPVYVSYFGCDNPAYEGLPGEELSPFYAFYRPRRWLELKPGLYCIGATMLQDVYSPVRGEWTTIREATYKRLLERMRTELAEGKRTPDIAELGEGPSEPLWFLDRLRFARLCLYLRMRPPDAVIGYSQFIFRLDAEEVRIAVDGTPQELSALMERALKRRDR